MNDSIVNEGDTVIAHMHDGSIHTLRVTSGLDQKIGRTRTSVKSIIGEPYGTIFEIDNKRKLKKLDNCYELLESFDEVHDNSMIGGDNSNYVDTNTAQKLSMSEVVELQNAGKTGVEIIKTLIANSETWASKTEFAQEKWLKRKQKKYLTRIRIEKCNPYSLCEVYHLKKLDKICGIRSDTLAQILSHSGIHSNSKVLVFDGTIGLVVGSVAYRMRGNGRILGVYGGQQPHFELVDSLNLDYNSTKNIHVS